MSFKGIQAGDKVLYRKYVPGSKRMPTCAGRVNPLLIFDDHVVLNVGNNGTVVNARNFRGIYRDGKVIA